MKQGRGVTLLDACLLWLCTLAPPIGIQYLYFQEPPNLDLAAAVGLLTVNVAFFMGFSRVKSNFALKMGLSYGLLLLSAKLFVNTFTIFLLIGLQAVRTHVFVPEFFAGYAALLMGGVLFLHRNSKRL